MAEIIAKREARRRKILENSENRLQKITGRNGCNKSAVTTPKRENEDNDVTCDMKFGTENNPLLMLNHHYNYDDTSKDLNSYDAISRRLNSINFDGHNNTLSHIKQANTNSTSKTLFTYKPVENLFSYVLLAAVVNILLILKLEHVFGKAITIPYIIMMLGRMCLYGNFRNTQSSSLLVAALILCNVKPEVTYKLKAVMTLCNTVLYDLALYIFSFTLMHYVISLYLRNTEILIL